MDTGEYSPIPTATPVDDTSTNITNRIMHVIVVVLAVVAGIAAYRFVRPSTSFAADGDPRWNDAVERSQSSHTPALILFTADWCGACQALHSQVLSRSDVNAEIANHYTMLTIDLTAQTPANVERARKYGVSAIPTLIRFDAEGKETSRTHNLSPERMLAWLRDGE